MDTDSGLWPGHAIKTVYIYEVIVTIRDDDGTKYDLHKKFFYDSKMEAIGLAQEIINRGIWIDGRLIPPHRVYEVLLRETDGVGNE